MKAAQRTHTDNCSGAQDGLCEAHHQRDEPFVMLFPIRAGYFHRTVQRVPELDEAGAVVAKVVRFTGNEYVDAVLHGDGPTSLQLRDAKVTAVAATSAVLVQTPSVLLLSLPGVCFLWMIHRSDSLPHEGRVRSRYPAWIQSDRARQP